MKLLLIIFACFQSFHQKLTKSSQTEREIALMDYIKNDIFGCTKPGILRVRENFLFVQFIIFITVH